MGASENAGHDSRVFVRLRGRPGGAVGTSGCRPPPPGPLQPGGARRPEPRLRAAHRGPAPCDVGSDLQSVATEVVGLADTFSRRPRRPRDGHSSVVKRQGPKRHAERTKRRAGCERERCRPTLPSAELGSSSEGKRGNTPLPPPKYPLRVFRDAVIQEEAPGAHPGRGGEGEGWVPWVPWPPAGGAAVSEAGAPERGRKGGCQESR